MAQKSKNNNKMNMNMPRPSMLWIYGLIGLFIIGWYLFDGSNEAPLPSDWTTVQEMVEKGDVEKIQVVNRDQAQVFLKKEAGEKYRNDQVDKRFRRLPESGVQLTFTIGSVDSFREDLKAAEEKSGQTVPVIYENKANDWTSILINLLPWVVIIGAWFFIMRSMSRGAGAGGGGGIMNVGKAKAQVFDKDNSKRVTFKDVAGLEEAKVEIMEIVDFLKKADKYKELGAKIPKGALLVGPPGTGKTTTLVEAIYETLHRESQVLVCAQSNMAVDWISEKLTDRGVAVLRVGNPSRVNDKMLSFTYERRFEAHPSYPSLWAIRKAIRDLYAHRPSLGREAFHQKVARLRDQATELEIAINESLFNEARVIACTLAGSANRVLAGKKFPTLFIDEAAQALEASCWIAIQKAGRVILAGDHRQLPPTVKCPEALKGGLDRTLMETIAARHPSAVSLLRTQYRMNNIIMRFSSECFYDGKVESAPEVKYRGILDWDTPMEWIDTADEEQTAPYLTEEPSGAVCAPALPAVKVPDFGETRNPDSTSRSNPEEARLTLNILKAYFQKIGKERILAERIDTGIISPYKGQVQLLRALLRRDAFFKPYRHLLSVNTVDGFQGQERDVILISLVRSNENGQIGFLHDLRRMNVAITRARMKLLVGNSHTLCRTPFYKLLHGYIKSLDAQ